MSVWRTLAALLLVASAVPCVSAESAAPAPKAPKYVIHWVLAHEPAGVFARAAHEFGRLVNKESNGDIVVKVIHVAKFGNRGYVSPRYAMHAVETGRYEMTQDYTTALGHASHPLWVLDMPYLFRDHAHAAKVLDGPIGRQLLAGLPPSMKGLAFTYSGGYRILPTLSREIHTPADVKGLRVRTAPTPVAEATLRALGAVPVPADITDINKLVKEGKIDGGESTLARYADGQGSALPIINVTKHSLFLTAVIVNTKFYDSLPKRDQEAVDRAADQMAHDERTDTIQANIDEEKSARSKGETVVTLTPQEQAEFVQAVQPVYKEFTPRFHGLVQRIEQTR
ncbi:MAG: TRAP transporter substrate-binding protein [Elusimicrobia bacterium]|nr:TRAP transporter substrate-binding protein [Elusimicrobiota bacterium]